MEKNEISIHEVRIVCAIFGNASKWLTNKEITQKAGDVSERTVRAHTLKLVKLGILDQAEVFPAHRYRWSDKSEKRNASYFLRLKSAADVFGMNLSPHAAVKGAG